MSVPAGDAVVGEVTSGTFSPTRKAGIALALLDRAAGLAEGDRSRSTSGAAGCRCRWCKPPFVPPSVR